MLPFPQYARDGQISAEQASDLPRNGQTESRPAKLGGNGRVTLVERLEELRKNFRADADPGVDHLERDGR